MEGVLGLYPDSHCEFNGEEWEVWCCVSGDFFEVMGAGLTQDAAWEAALETARVYSGKVQ